MNYRHAFHAGNFADVHKHSVLARILVHLRRKPAAFRVIDTHAGAGRYDLLAPEPSRSGEWHDGIERIWEGKPQHGPDALLAPYLAAVAALNPDGRLRIYPGSPLIAKYLLRPQDRLIACELEPRSAAALAAALRGDARAKAVAIDGWTALGAYVPPKERRGLVLIDPPFEDAADFLRLSSALAAALSQMADRHLPAVVPDQGSRRAGRAGAAAAKACCTERFALRADARSAARGSWSGRLRTDRGQSAIHARSGFADFHARSGRGAVAAGGQPDRLAGARTAGGLIVRR